MIDLLDIHLEKMKNGLLSPSPSQWCCQGKMGLGMKSVLRSLNSLPPPFKIKGKTCDGTETITLNEKYNEKPGDYLAEPYAAKEYREYVPEGRGLEDCYRALYLYEHPNSKIEVDCPVGKIDCLSDIEIVEFKNAKFWKEGLGQLLAYSVYYPSKKKKLYLFGNTSASTLEIEKVTQAYGVSLHFN